MKTVVIILKQNKDRGKTSTLKKLTELIKANPSTSIIEEYPYIDGKDLAGVYQSGNESIGIITIGDPGYENQFREGIKLCKKYYCKIIIVATRQQLTCNGKEAPYGIIWDTICKEDWLAFEVSPYVTYPNCGHMDEDFMHNLCAKNLLTTITTLL